MKVCRVNRFNVKAVTLVPSQEENAYVIPAGNYVKRIPGQEGKTELIQKFFKLNPASMPLQASVVEKSDRKHVAVITDKDVRDFLDSADFFVKRFYPGYELFEIMTPEMIEDNMSVSESYIEKKGKFYKFATSEIDDCIILDIRKEGKEEYQEVDTEDMNFIFSDKDRNRMLLDIFDEDDNGALLFFRGTTDEKIDYEIEGDASFLMWSIIFVKDRRTGKRVHRRQNIIHVTNRDNFKVTWTEAGKQHSCTSVDGEIVVESADLES